MSDQTSVPNHHAHYRGFSGLAGWIAALSMVAGRGSDAELAARLTGLQPTDSVVDVGCGPGAAARHAAATGATVTGVDPAPVMLRFARLLTRARGVRFVEGTAEELPLDDGSVTVLWSIATAHHWADIDAGLREAQRVLAPGGRMAVIERRTAVGARGHASHGWTRAQADTFKDRCLEHGFVGVGVEENAAGRRRTLSVTARTV